MFPSRVMWILFFSGATVFASHASADGTASPETDKPAENTYSIKDLPASYKAAIKSLQLTKEDQLKIAEALQCDESKDRQEKMKETQDEVYRLEARSSMARTTEDRRDLYRQSYDLRHRLDKMKEQDFALTQKQIMKALNVRMARRWPAALLAAEAVDAYDGILDASQIETIFKRMDKSASRVRKAKSFSEVEKMRRELIRQIFESVLTNAQIADISEYKRYYYRYGRSPKDSSSSSKSLSRARRIREEEVAKLRGSDNKNDQPQRDSGDGETPKGDGDAEPGNSKTPPSDGAGGWGS